MCFERRQLLTLKGQAVMSDDRKNQQPNPFRRPPDIVLPVNRPIPPDPDPDWLLKKLLGRK
jgi:hypothetical protein